MGHAENDSYIVGKDDLILVTGATGFIGSRLVAALAGSRLSQFALLRQAF